MLDINTAGSEFVKAVIKLYRSAKYFCEKEILANKFMDSSIECGRLCDEVSVTADKLEKCNYAKAALEELSRAMFALKIMGETGIYSKRRTQPVFDIGAELKELLKRHAVAPVVVPLPQPAPLPEDDNLQLSMLPHESDEGFNEVYTGNI